MEIATTIVPLILQPAIDILLKRFLDASSGVHAYENDLQTVSLKVFFLKELLRQALDRIHGTVGLTETLTESVKQHLERWFDVMEEAETTITECNSDNEASTSCLPPYGNIKRIKQIKDRITEIHNEAFLVFNLFHLQTSSQNGLQPAADGLPSRESQRILTCLTPQVKRLQETASRVTVSHWFNGQLMPRGIVTYATDFALRTGPGNPPIPVILDREEGEINSESMLLQSLGNPQETVVQIVHDGILVTTNFGRIQEVEALSEEERWEVFRFHIFGNSESQHIYSHDIEGLSRAWEVFRSIARMPCLVEAVAHILARVKNPFYWQLKSLLFRPPPEHLYDRYSALPSYVKLCFLSCAAFPKDEERDVENLVELWIAEGLLPIMHNPIELVTYGYLVVKLLLRYRLIEVSDYDWAGRPVHCTLPDRIHYMAAEILREDRRCFFRPGEDLDQFFWPESPLCRSISLVGNNIRLLPKRSGSPFLRSLLLAGNVSLQHVPRRFLKGLTSLRVLDLSNTGIVSLPSSLGDLKRLIYLNLSCTKIQRLPKYINRLKKLESLILSSCPPLEFLPLEICQLQCLKHLDVSGCKSLKSLPYKITRLEALQILKTNATQVWKSRATLRELFFKRQRKMACLSDLKALGNLKRLHLDSEDESVIPEGVMTNKRKMQSLWLRMTKLEALPQDMTAMTDLGELQLWKCMRLQELPDWVCEFCELRFLCLNRCYSLRRLPCLERMPLLRSLQIEFCESLMELPSDFGRDGAFPTLQSFVLVGMKIRMLPAIESGSMPQLKYMALKSCQNLNRLAVGIEFMENLQTLDVTDSLLLIQSMSSAASNPSALPRSVQIIPHITS